MGLVVGREKHSQSIKTGPICFLGLGPAESRVYRTSVLAVLGGVS